MTCALVFHFKVKKPISQAAFLGDSRLVLLTENSLLVFGFAAGAFEKELRLWEDERTARYNRDFNLTDFDAASKGTLHWVVAGNEAGQALVWRLEETPEGLRADFQLFGVYSGTRTKRLKWVRCGAELLLAAVSTRGDVSVFDFSAETRREFSNDPQSEKPLAALAERQMDARLTQLGAVWLAPASVPKVASRGAPQKSAQGGGVARKKEPKKEQGAAPHKKKKRIMKAAPKKAQAKAKGKAKVRAKTKAKARRQASKPKT